MVKDSPEALARRNAVKKEWFNKLKDTDFPRRKERICKTCGKLKMCKWMSSFSHKGVPEYRAHCDECQNAIYRKQRKTDGRRFARNSVKKKTIALRKKWAVDLLGGECQICGYKKCLAALTFHHRDREEKEHGIGMILDWSEESIEKELEKCDLLCFNCHMELHHEGN